MYQSRTPDEWFVSILPVLLHFFNMAVRNQIFLQYYLHSPKKYDIITKLF